VEEIILSNPKSYELCLLLLFHHRYTGSQTVLIKSIRIVGESDTRISNAEAIKLFEDSNLFWFTMYNQKSTNMIMMTVF